MTNRISSLMALFRTPVYSASHNQTPKGTTPTDIPQSSYQDSISPHSLKRVLEGRSICQHTSEQTPRWQILGDQILAEVQVHHSSTMQTKATFQKIGQLQRETVIQKLVHHDRILDQLAQDRHHYQNLSDLEKLALSYFTPFGSNRKKISLGFRDLAKLSKIGFQLRSEKILFFALARRFAEAWNQITDQEITEAQAGIEIICYFLKPELAQPETQQTFDYIKKAIS